MYSVVLLLAITSGTEAVDFGRHNKGGCTGSCTGVVVPSGCTGVVVSGGCTGSCTGGHGHGLFSRLHNRHNGGCTGSCTGSCTGGIYDGGSGSCTGVTSGSCTGGHGHGLFSRLHNRHNSCTGGCGGVIINGGCYGGGCYGGGCVGTYGGGDGVVGAGGGDGVGVIMNPVGPVTTPAVPVETKKIEIKKTSQAAAPATLVVTLPSDARLVIDGRATTSTSGERTFVTPALAVGQTHSYTLRAEIVRDGQTLAQTQLVTVRGGETTAIPFSFNASGVASR